MPISERVAADIPVTIKTDSYSLLLADWGREIQFEKASAVSANLLPAGEAGNGYNVILRDVGAGALTIEPVLGEEIDGASSLVINTGDWRWIRSDGSGWKSIAASDLTLADGSVTTAKLADGAVTVAKLADEAKVYDMSFVAGFDSVMAAEDIAVQAYGQLVIARALTIEGEVGYIDTPSTGSAAIVDVLVNGATIYSSKPQFAATANALSAGTLSTTTLSAGDRLTFSVASIGSTEPGEGLRFTLKCRLA